MPNITFILPHWIYWGGLVAVPLAFMLAAARRRGAATGAAGGGVSLPVAYFFLVAGGFIGMHRLYLKQWPAAVFIALFVFIIACNHEAKETRNEHSIAKNAAFNLSHDLKEAHDLGEDDAAVAALEEKSAAAEIVVADLAARLAGWHRAAGIAAAVIAVLLLLELFLLPRAVRNLRRAENPPQAPPQKADASPRAGGVFERAVGGINNVIGEFVSYWTVIAVFVFYYEVIARYVFNSPTVWAHESMFLLFGMQYLLAGGFCLREKAHVRVDVFYARFPPRMRAAADVLTSLFFFIFAVSLTATGWIFFSDSYDKGQVSFTEWEIAYWPVKFALPLGGALITLQGLAHLLRDVRTLFGGGAHGV